MFSSVPIMALSNLQRRRQQDCTAKTAKMLAYILDTHKIYEPVYFSSSMDFADEYGFAHYNDAKTMGQS